MMFSGVGDAIVAGIRFDMGIGRAEISLVRYQRLVLCSFHDGYGGECSSVHISLEKTKRVGMSSALVREKFVRRPMMLH